MKAVEHFPLPASGRRYHELPPRLKVVQSGHSLQSRAVCWAAVEAAAVTRGDSPHCVKSLHLLTRQQNYIIIIVIIVMNLLNLSKNMFI